MEIGTGLGFALECDGISNNNIFMGFDISDSMMITEQNICSNNTWCQGIYGQQDKGSQEAVCKGEGQKTAWNQEKGQSLDEWSVIERCGQVSQGQNINSTVTFDSQGNVTIEQ